MLFPRKSSKWTPEEEAMFVQQVIDTMEALWRPARMLTDLRIVWNDLSDEQRAEIEGSKVYQAGFHERRGEEMAKVLGKLANDMPGGAYRDVRAELTRYLRDWRSNEPDTLKILIGKMRQAHRQSGGAAASAEGSEAVDGYQS